MLGTIIDLLLLCLLFAAAVLCVEAPLGALAIMFWHCQRELSGMARLRQVRSTQIR